MDIHHEDQAVATIPSDPARTILDIALFGGESAIDGMVSIDVALSAIRHALGVGRSMRLVGGRAIPAYVEEFLRAVRDNPGAKYPVESYHSPDDVDAEASWKIAERKGWVEAVGSHKWRTTGSGLAVLGMIDAGLADGESDDMHPSVEPFGYWVEQKGAEPSLLRRPAYIPEASDLRTVTPVYASPVRPDETMHARAASVESSPSGTIDLVEHLRDAKAIEYNGGGGWSLNLLFGTGVAARERMAKASEAIRNAVGRYATDTAG